MLGRSANGIFWMFRYLERAENIARLLEAGFHMALTRGASGAEEEWRSVLVTMGQHGAYMASHETIDGPQVFNFILRDRSNARSVLQMIENARTNARSVRTAITREVWEATNESWMLLKDMLSRPVRARNLGEVLSTIRDRTALVRGAMEGTMLRNEIFNFARTGTYVERADNTARILDVKYYVLLPSVSWVGSSLDNTQWDTVLRSVAGYRAYRWLNAGDMDPRGIAEFLILDERFPRSLSFSFNKLRSNLSYLEKVHGGPTPSGDMIRGCAEKLGGTTIGQIFDFGLHEYITDFIISNQSVANAIASDFRFVE
jgi:uncharacterized alpha-E superfamily protein